MEGNPRQLALVAPSGTRLYAYFRNISGCGGACETEALLVSDQPFPMHGPGHSDQSGSRIASTPVALAWTLYKAANGAHYAMGIVERHLHAYLIAAPKSWRRSCDIALTPERLRGSTDPAVQEALKSLDALNVTIQGLTREEGNCGSMRTASRWRGYVTDALDETLYRPWALPVSDEGAMRSENSYGDYARIIGQLKLWSLGGLSEHQSFAAYVVQLGVTRQELGRFYSKKNCWSPATSDRVANVALESAIARGFGFYLYSPFPGPNEVELRKAILEHRLMGEIESISSDESTMSGVLDAAVQYPEALRYLLLNGANSDATNAFGKTPLMYAAQYDQFESAKLLLDSGADPNAATTWPPDTCSYALTTARMTPLHYAVRYASPRVIQLLLARGAFTFNKTEKQYAEGEYPLDWFRRYTDPASPERNANLPAVDVSRMVEPLQVPNAAKRATIAAGLTKRAQADYAAGKVENSYRGLVAALSAEPDNERALTDLPLVALRSGRLGQSLEAADAVLAKIKSSSSQASAWFNKGLACEQNDYKFLTYNGRFYCMGDSVYPFLQAWKLDHSEARRNKLREVFQDSPPRTCEIAQEGKMAQRYRFELANTTAGGKYGQVQRIYVLHASGQTIDAASISWTIRFYNALKPTTFVPRIVERYDLGEFAITELNADRMATGVVTIGDQTCSPYK
jgi:hypothetical protein